MEKVLKKIFLLTILMYELFRQLFLGVVAFFFIRTKKIDKKVLMISIGAIGILFFFGVIVSSSKMFASSHTQSKNIPPVINSNLSEIPIESLSNETISTNSTNNKQSKPISSDDSELSSSNVSIDTIEQNLKEAEAISLQATAITGKVSLGRAEPFAPIFAAETPPSAAGIPSIPGMPGAPGVKPLSAKEIAEQKAEQRRNEIRESLNNNITLKGIVLNKNKSRPMAVIQVSKGDGSKETRPIMPGQQLYLPNCVAKVSSIAENRIGLQAEDVKVDRYLPEINDEENFADGGAPAPSGGMESEKPGGSSGGLMPPPTPNNSAAPSKRPGSEPNNSSMGDAKKKIDEIDKLLNSF